MGELGEVLSAGGGSRSSTVAPRYLLAHGDVAERVALFGSEVDVAMFLLVVCGGSDPSR